MKSILILAALIFIVIHASAQQPQGDPKLTEIWSPVPKLVTPGKSAADAPSDAIILFKNKKDSDISIPLRFYSFPSGRRSKT